MFVFVFFMITGCKKDEKSDTVPTSEGTFNCGGTFTDERDGNIYTTVKIGNQCWMSENLNYSSSNSWCYEDSSSYCNKYGRLYDWSTAQNACPSGWRFPSKSDFEKLLDKVGGTGNAGIDARYALGEGGSSGFNALFGGMRNGDGSFCCIDAASAWWSFTEEDADKICVLGISEYDYCTGIFSSGKDAALYIRCIKD